MGDNVIEKNDQISGREICFNSGLDFVSPWFDLYNRVFVCN